MADGEKKEAAEPKKELTPHPPTEPRLRHQASGIRPTPSGSPANAVRAKASAGRRWFKQLCKCDTRGENCTCTGVECDEQGRNAISNPPSAALGDAKALRELLEMRHSLATAELRVAWALRRGRLRSRAGGAEYRRVWASSLPPGSGKKESGDRVRLAAHSLTHPLTWRQRVA